MSKVHFFQRYSTKENTVTNNTLQLFVQINNHSPARFDELFTTLVGTPLNIGLEVSQQRRGEKSVPDGVIQQRSFKLLVEAKVESGVSVDQLISHCANFGSEEQKILLLLTIDPVSKSKHDEIVARIGECHTGISFRNVTYRKICEALENLFAPHEEHIAAIAEDYRSYCWDAELMSGADFLMRIVPTGDSFDLNQKYAMYFDPADRGYTQHAIIGFYTKKAVRSMIKIRSIFEVEYVEGQLRKTRVFGDDTDIFDDKIKAMISEARRECGYEIAINHKFFCGDHAFPTHFVKTTPNGIQGARLKDLREYGVKDSANTAEIAEHLSAKTWT